MFNWYSGNDSEKNDLLNLFKLSGKHSECDELCLVSPGGLGLVSPQRIFVDAAPKGRVEPGLKSLETKESTCALH